MGRFDVTGSFATRAHTLEGHTRTVYSVAFSPGGGTLASGSRDTTVLLWNVQTKGNFRILSPG